MSQADDAHAAGIEAARRDTAAYALQPEFRAAWLGINRRSRDLLAQQIRAFGGLLEDVTTTLSGWNILDVGCGDGRWLRRMVEYDARPQDVVGVDISDARFAIARAKNPLIEFIRLEGPALPFEDGRFDLVTEFVCFSHMPTRELRQAVAAEMQRVTRPGGYIFWWDQPHLELPGDRTSPLDPADYFDWPIRRMSVGERPVPSETLRPFRGRSLVGRALDRLRHPVTHTAALIGPKP